MKIKLLYQKIQKVTSEIFNENNKITNKQNKALPKNDKYKKLSKKQKNENILSLKENKKIQEDDEKKYTAEEYDEDKNYYVKYWELWKENEIIVAKIKEKVYEIDLIVKYLDKNIEEDS